MKKSIYSKALNALHKSISDANLLDLPQVWLVSEEDYTCPFCGSSQLSGLSSWHSEFGLFEIQWELVECRCGCRAVWKMILPLRQLTLF